MNRRESMTNKYWVQGGWFILNTTAGFFCYLRVMSEQAREILVSIVLSSNECSGEPVHMRGSEWWGSGIHYSLKI